MALPKLPLPKLHGLRFEILARLAITLVAAMTLIIIIVFQVVAMQSIDEASTHAEATALAISEAILPSVPGYNPENNVKSQKSVTMLVTRLSQTFELASIYVANANGDAIALAPLNYTIDELGKMDIMEVLGGTPPLRRSQNTTLFLFGEIPKRSRAVVVEGRIA